jgi:3-oxoacyl-[acyl-carrier protein] reductase
MSSGNTTQRLIGKKALVTGASRGIGAAIALRLAEEGADVAITYQSSPDKAAAVVRSIEALGRKAAAIKADSGDAAAVRASVESAFETLGGLDILVNNAGIARGGDIADMSLEDIDATLAINVRSVIVASQAAARRLPEGGRIISIGSCLGEQVGVSGISVYSASKSALIGLTKGIARDLGPRGITVNVVQPGPTDTDMNPADGDQAPSMLAGMAIKRYGKPEDITGARITLDGGVNA